jgi:hypothetical protein
MIEDKEDRDLNYIYDMYFQSYNAGPLMITLVDLGIPFEERETEI